MSGLQPLVKVVARVSIILRHAQLTQLPYLLGKLKSADIRGCGRQLVTQGSGCPEVGQPESGDFFERNGLLFASPAEVKQNAEGLVGARPLLSALVADPSLRGIMKALSFAAQGVEAGNTKLDQLAWPLSRAKQTLGDVLADRPASFTSPAFAIAVG